MYYRYIIESVSVYRYSSVFFFPGTWFVFAEYSIALQCLAVVRGTAQTSPVLRGTREIYLSIGKCIRFIINLASHGNVFLA